MQRAYRELLKSAKADEQREANGDEMHAAAAGAEVAEVEEAEEEEIGDWREDIPWLSAAFVFCGAVAALLVVFPYSLAGFSLSLLAALQGYRRARSAFGEKAERSFKLFVRVYFVVLLAMGVGWLGNKIWVGFLTI